MRIGITCYPSQGGSGVVATELGLMLAERGHDIHFISYAQPIRLASYPFRHRLTVHEVDTPTYPVFQYPPYELALASKMVEVIDDSGLDILHVHYAIPHAIAAWLASEMVGSKHVQIVTTLHGTDITLVGQDPAYFKPTCFALARSDGITAVSQYLKDETCRIFGIECSRIEAIPNFVDLERFRPLPADERAELRRDWVSRGEFVLMHLSNFRSVKRSLDAVRVWLRLRQTVPSKLVLIGEGPELRECRALAAEARALSDLVLLGRQVAVWELLPLADAYVLTSEQESFGLSALEAMACGVPVVGTNVGGVPEVILDGDTGFLCEVGDTDGMAIRLEALAADSASAARMALRSRQHAEVFEATRIVSQYEALYERLCSNPDLG